MLTFIQFLLIESEYFGGPKTHTWGTIHPHGHLVPGHSTKNFNNHAALIASEIKKTSGNVHSKQFIHYTASHDDLNIGGHADHKTVRNTLSNWSKLPHSPTGHVNLDLYHPNSHYRIQTSGNHKKVYGELRKHADKFEA